MPRQRANADALTLHRLVSMGYTRILGVEFQRGTGKWDMGGVVTPEKLQYCNDGRPKYMPVAGIYDILMSNDYGVTLAVQTTGRSNVANRISKVKANADFASYEGMFEIWGWDTVSNPNGTYRVRVVDPRHGIDRDYLFKPALPQSNLQLG